MTVVQALGVSIWNTQFIPLCTGQEQTGKSSTFPLWSRVWLAEKVTENTSWIPSCFLITDACTCTHGQWNLWMWHHLFCWSGGVLLPESTLWLAVICPYKSQNSTIDFCWPRKISYSFHLINPCFSYKTMQNKLHSHPFLWYMDLPAWIKAEPFLLL